MGIDAWCNTKLQDLFGLSYNKISLTQTFFIYLSIRSSAILLGFFKVSIWQRRYNWLQRRFQAWAFYCFSVQPFIPFILHAPHLCALCALLWLVSTSQHSMFLCLQYWSPVLHSCIPAGMSLGHRPNPNHYTRCAYNCF